jgi:hypothetical protein
MLVGAVRRAKKASGVNKDTNAELGARGVLTAGVRWGEERRWCKKVALDR